MFLKTKETVELQLVSMTLIVVGALGKVSKYVEKGMEAWEFRGLIETI